jgi:hypothetical protein
MATAQETHSELGKFRTWRLSTMSKVVRALVAGWGAKKVSGCGCAGLIVFIILWYLLGASGLQIFQ